MVLLSINKSDAVIHWRDILLLLLSAEPSCLLAMFLLDLLDFIDFNNTKQRNFRSPYNKMGCDGSSMDVIKYKMNIRTGEVRVLKYDAGIVDDIMRQIILSKYKTVIPKTDLEFIQHLTC
jgi:hypothetical protein